MLEVTFNLLVAGVLFLASFRCMEKANKGVLALCQNIDDVWMMGWKTIVIASLALASVMYGFVAINVLIASF